MRLFPPETTPLGCVGFPLHGVVCVAVRGLSVVLRYFGGVRSLVFGTRRLPRSSVAIGRRSALKICSVPVSWPGTALFAWVGVHQFSARCSCCAYSTAPGIHSSRLGLHLPPPPSFTVVSLLSTGTRDR